MVCHDDPDQDDEGRRDYEVGYDVPKHPQLLRKGINNVRMVWCAYIVKGMEALAVIPALPGLVQGGVEPEGDGGHKGG